MSRFGMSNPFNEHVALVAENFLGMMKYTFEVEEGGKETRERYFATHGAAYPEHFRQAFKAATTNLSSWSVLFLEDTDHRARVHINRYSHTNNDPISNPLMFFQESLRIDMLVHPPPVTDLRNMKTGQWRVNVGVGPEGSMLCANSPLQTPPTPQCDHRSDGVR